MKIQLSRDWTEFLSALISLRMRFVLVGGHAVAGHGEPRLAEDLDTFVGRSLANAKKLRQALSDFGFGHVAPTAAELARPHKLILTSIDGVTFEQAWKSRVKVEFKVELYVIGRDMLIKHKRAAGATKTEQTSPLKEPPRRNTRRFCFRSTTDRLEGPARIATAAVVAIAAAAPAGARRP